MPGKGTSSPFTGSTDRYEPPEDPYPPLREEQEAGATLRDMTTAEDLRYPRRSGSADLSPPPVIHTKEFRRWFGDWKTPGGEQSVVTDEAGRPAVVYHGTLLPTDTQIEELRSGDHPISRGLGVHVAFDNRLTDAFTVGREAKKRPRDPVMERTSAGERAMANIEQGAGFSLSLPTSAVPLTLPVDSARSGTQRKTFGMEWPTTTISSGTRSRILPSWRSPP
jgi:hypothetical protein